MRKKQQFLLPTLTNEVAAQLLAEFIDWTCKAGHAAQVSRGFAAYAEFFTRIEALNAKAVNNEVIKRHFLVEELRRLGYVTQFLSEHGYLLASGGDRQNWSEERRIADLLDRAKAIPCGALVVEYEAWLSKRTVMPLAIRTKRMYLRAAMSWLTHEEAASVGQLTNSSLQGYLKKSPGQRASLTSFLHFLVERHGSQIKMAPRKKKNGKNVERKKVKLVEQLLSALQQDHPAQTKRACLAKLLSTLYTVPLEKVLNLPVTAISNDGKEMRLTIDEVIIDLDVRIAPFLSYYLLDVVAVGRRDDRLFRGRIAADSLSSSAVNFHLQKLKTSM